MPSISVLEESNPQPLSKPLIEEVGRGDSTDVEASEPPPSTLLIKHVAEESAPLKEAPKADCELCPKNVVSVVVCLFFS